MLSFLFCVQGICLARAAARIGSLTCFGCAVAIVRQGNVPMRVWSTLVQSAWGGVRWDVKLRQEAPYSWASRGYCIQRLAIHSGGTLKQRPVRVTKCNCEDKKI